MKELIIFYLAFIALVACENNSIDGCGGQPPPPFRAIIYDENNQNVLCGDNCPDTILFYTIKDGVRYSEQYYEIINIGDSSQLGLYSNGLPDIPSSNTYYLEVAGDVDTLQVEIIEETDSKGCDYLTYGAVQFNGSPAEFYPWRRGGGMY